MDKGINIEFLQLLGWRSPELETFLPDWIHAAEYLNLTESDIRKALDSWLPQYWDLTLLSVRKFIMACIREVVAVSKIKEYKAKGDGILYTNSTASHVCIAANRIAGKGKLHVFYPDFIITTVLSAFFGKNPSERAGNGQDISCVRCALNKSYAVYCTSGLLPSPTVSWNWGLHCNESGKTEELIRCMECQTGEEVYLSIPHDAELGCDESLDAERTAYLADQIREGQQRVSEITGVPVTEEHMRQAMDEYIDYMRRMEVLTDLVVTADPQPISGNELTLFGMCMQICFDTGLTYVNDALDTAILEVRDRIERGVGVLPKGAPKLACHFQPLNFPWVGKAFQDNGVNLTMGRIFPPASWLEERIDSNDMYLSAARHCLMCPDAVNMKAGADIAAKVLNLYSFDGALYGFFSNCRWIGALQKTMILDVEKNTGIPHYFIQGDFWGVDGYNLDDRLPMIRSICNSLKIARF